MKIIIDAIVAFVIMKFFPIELSLQFMGLLCMVAFLRFICDVYYWCSVYQEALQNVNMNKEETEEAR